MRLFISLLLILSFFPTLPAACDSHTWWEIRDMFHCSGDARNYVSYDGSKSTVRTPGGDPVLSLVHCIRYADYSTDTFVIEFGEVSPGVKWELVAVPLDDNTQTIPVMKGTDGGVYRFPLANLGLSSLSFINMVLRLSSEAPGSIEVLRWAVETTRPNKFAQQHEMAAKALARRTPLERGLVPHWNPDIGSFVCAYNATHPEHYNYWIEDEGEKLWSIGNYPEMMQLYGKGLRDFLVKYCKTGAPVRKVGNAPVFADLYLKPGEYSVDTGVIHVKGNLTEDPYINIHPSVYEHHGLLASVGDFFVSYRTSSGLMNTIKFNRPDDYSIEYNTPRKDVVRLRVAAADRNLSARFTLDVFRGRVTANVDVANTGSSGIGDVVAGFTLRDCDRYYHSPINRLKQMGHVALLYSEQHALATSNIIRLAGPVARSIDLRKKADGVIQQADVSSAVSPGLAPGRRVALKLADINCGSSCFVNKIEMYKNVDFAEADISMSYVNTYALLGLATYSYRYPEDKEARDVTDRMMENFVRVRDRMRDRELGYLLWSLSLLERDEDATIIADLIEKRIANVESFDGPLDSSAMAIGLRMAGRWDAADDICAKTEHRISSIHAPTDVVAYACMQSASVAEKCYWQFSDILRLMYWDEPHRLTAHNERWVEEGPQEMQAYSLVFFDVISRHYGGVFPVRLDPFAGTRVTSMSYDANTGDWRASLVKTGEVDVFTGFRAPKRVLWNQENLPADSWTYNEDTGVVYFRGISGDGELTISVGKAVQKSDSEWEPIDYLGLKKRSTR